MYKLEYLPAARQDMMDIVRYISRELCNPTAAERLAMELIQAGDSILGFPYANPAYTPIRPLKHTLCDSENANHLSIVDMRYLEIYDGQTISSFHRQLQRL